MALSNWGDLADSAEDIADGGYTLLPEGDYNIVVTATEVVQSSTGKTGYKTENEVLDGEHAGRKVFNTYYVSPESTKAMGMFFKQMSALGLDKDEYFKASEPTDDDIANDLLGATFIGTIKHVKSQDGQKTYANIVNLAPLDDEDAEGAPQAPAPAKKAPAGPKGPGAGAKPRRATNRRLPTTPANSPV